MSLRIDVTPEDGLIDDPLHVTVADGSPGERVTITARLQDGFGRTWSAEAGYVADQNGSVDLKSDRPVDGSYQGVDPMGLLWAMEASSSEFVAPFIQMDAEAGTVSITANTASGATTEQLVTRRYQAPGVRRVPIAGGGVTGVLFEPAQAQGPGVVVLGGSNGGMMEDVAALLASRDMPALALSYFRGPGLPDALVEIPLEYIGGAVEWLTARHETGGAVALLGVSRGAELALLTAAHFPRVAAVAAYVPSAYVHSGISMDLSAGVLGMVDRPSWTMDGTPVPYLRPSGEPLAPRPGPGGTDVLCFASEYDRALDAADESVAIPVERINGPVFLVGAGDDLCWPSGQFCERIAKRLAAAEFRYPVEQLDYPEAGHMIGAVVPHRPSAVSEIVDPTSGTRLYYGGDPAADAMALRDAWPRLLAFLRRASERSA